MTRRLPLWKCLRGTVCRRAMITQIDEILILLSASDTFNKLNIGRTLKESLNKMLPSILDTAAKNSRSVRVYVMTAFGCPYTGKISIEDIVQLLLKLSYMGASEVVLVDSTGMANPRSVQSTLRILLDLQLDINLAVHFHNTRGAAIANCVAAYDAGVRIFDTSLGGMSATPYGVSELDIGCWNVPTEDLVHLFEEMGVKTGVDLEKLLDCVRLAEQMAGMHLPGHLLRAGRSSQIVGIPKHLERHQIMDKKIGGVLKTASMLIFKSADVYFVYTLQFQSFLDLFEHGLFSLIVWSVHQAEPAGDAEGLQSVVLVLDQDR
ncbi:MAG: hypothetical protein CVU51_12975 [Deltaproteobacteria bacterium HGW-Deltaproteobacteria-1]|nr:MAG: hypothetical protein CVU51_12975 [Deltaproteobacteria bacterium HGW-Deltaproteobacteria-1]